MKIYTKTGDSGKTGLWGSERVSKNEVRIQLVGTLDEANATIGCALSFLDSHKPSNMMAIKLLEIIQNKLFDAGADIANAKTTKQYLIEESSVSELEEIIDGYEAQLPPLQNFILPGGTQAAAFIHLARTTIRRAERMFVELTNKESYGTDYVVNETILKYLNRLSDLLFVVARSINYNAGTGDTIYQSSHT